MTFDENLHPRASSGEFAPKSHTAPDFALADQPLIAEVFVSGDDGQLVQENIDTRPLLDQHSVEDIEILESTGKLRFAIEDSVRTDRGYDADREIEAFVPDDLDFYLDTRRSVGLAESPAERSARDARLAFEPMTKEENAAMTARMDADGAFVDELNRREAERPAPRVEIRSRWWESKEKARNLRTIEQMRVSTLHRSEITREMTSEGWGTSQDGVPVMPRTQRS